MKLREGNVLSVCQSVQGGHVIITHGALDPTIQGSSLAPVPPLKTGIWGPPLNPGPGHLLLVAITGDLSNLFIGAPCTDPPTGTDI